MSNEFDNVPVHTESSLAKSEQEPNKITQVRDLITSRKNHIKGLLPKHMDAGRLARLALLAIRKTPRLLNCSPESLVGAVIQAAQLGLEPDGTLGQAYLVPYKTECTLQVGYRGMIELARRSGKVEKIAAHVVYEGDEFLCSFGLDEKLHHVPKIVGKRGNPIAVYAIATLQDGGHIYDVLTLQEVEKARSSAMSSNIWNQYWDEMAKKTAVRRLFKYLPISIEVATAVALDEMGEAGVSQHLDLTLADDDELGENKILPVEGSVTMSPDESTPHHVHEDGPRTDEAERKGDTPPETQTANEADPGKPDSVLEPDPDDIPFGDDTVPQNEPGKDADGDDDPFALS